MTKSISEQLIREAGKFLSKWFIIVNFLYFSMKNFSFKFNNKKIKISVKKVLGFEKGAGLMFSSRKKAKALLFEFGKPVKISFTSLFVFFPFIIIWLDSRNNVLYFKKIKPFAFHIPSLKPCRRVLEIPFNNNYEKIINKFFKSSSEENI